MEFTLLQVAKEFGFLKALEGASDTSNVVGEILVVIQGIINIVFEIFVEQWGKYLVHIFTVGKNSSGFPRNHSPIPAVKFTEPMRFKIHHRDRVKSTAFPGEIHYFFQVEFTAFFPPQSQGNSPLVAWKFTTSRGEIHCKTQGNSPQGWVNPNGMFSCSAFIFQLQ
jgi:hypothetical protein